LVVLVPFGVKTSWSSPDPEVQLGADADGPRDEAQRIIFFASLAAFRSKLGVLDEQAVIEEL